MRRIFVGLLLVSCSGDDDAVRKDPEICDDDIDNNGDGLVDCEDEASCGGLICRDQGDDDDDTSVPPADIEVIYDPAECCNFDFDCPGGDKSIGTFLLVNRTTDVDTQFDVKCATVGPSLSPIEFQVVGSTAQPVPVLINANLFADTQVSVEAFFSCKPQLTQDFDTLCNVLVESDSDEWSTDIQVYATHQ